MSIFPKRTIAGSYVTIHWNLNASALMEEHICPFVRIGVIDPAGRVTMLFEKHVLVLPSIGSPVPADIMDDNTQVYLNKNIPLLLLADYLSGRQTREKLVEILKNIHSGRHYYFTYLVDADAIPGKYNLLSEIYIEGMVKYSGTGTDDFFYVEKVSVDISDYAESSEKDVVVKNYSNEPTPVKILSYSPGNKLALNHVQVFEMKPQELISIQMKGEKKYLSYNEERIIIPMYKPTAMRCIRNQQWISMNKYEENENVVYLLHKEEDISYKLKGTTKDIWMKADGLTTRECIIQASSQEAYNEMLAGRLIIEI